MRLPRKTGYIISLIQLSLFVLVFCVSNELAIPEENKSAKKIFSVEDCLSLNALNVFSQPKIANNGERVAYAFVDKYYESLDKNMLYHFTKGSHVSVRPIQGGKTYTLTSGDQNSWGPSWSPDGQKLAFYIYQNRKVSLEIWEEQTGKTSLLELPNCLGRDAIHWGPDGNKIFFTSTDYSWHGPLKPYHDDEDPIVRRTSQEVNPYDAEYIAFTAKKIACLDLETKEVTTITPKPVTILSFQASPDGKNMAVLVIIKHKIRVPVPPINNLVVYPVGKGQPITIVTESKITQYAWSPDSASIAYIDKGQLWIYSMTDRKSRLLSDDQTQLNGLPLWNPHGTEILCSGGENFHLIDLITNKILTLEISTSFKKEAYFWDKKGNSIFFKVLDEETGDQGIFRFSPKSNDIEKLVFGAWMIQNIGLAKNHLIFTLQNSVTPENIYSLNLKTKQKTQITSLNDHIANFRLGKSELITWHSTEGADLKGILLYPADYIENRTYPVVFWVYETFSSNLHRFYLHLYNLQILTNRGYAVCLPDVKFKTGEAAASYVRCIEPALDKMEELGVANGIFGVMGHSFGGYATNVLASKIKRFKAAIAISGISDWVSFHGLPGDYMRLSNEKGQGRLGGDLREFPERYVKNSPVFFLDQTITPLMIIHGTEDSGVPFSQAEEMYYGLRRVGKEAVLIAYPGEGHLYWGTKVRVIKDMWQRIIFWFDQHMK